MDGNHSMNHESGETFRQALSAFRSCMDRQDWSGAAEKAELASQIPGYADDPRITDIYEELAAKAVPSSLKSFEIVLVMENPVINTSTARDKRRLTVSRDHRYAVLPVGKLWNLRENAEENSTGPETDALWAASDYSNPCREFTTEQQKRIDAILKKDYSGIKNPCVFLPDGVILAVGISWPDMDACAVDFINTESGERLCRKMVWQDPVNFILEPKEMAVTEDGRYLFCAFRHAFKCSKGVLIRMEWDY